MKKVLLLTGMIFFISAPNIALAEWMEISASDGDLYEIISADTLEDGTQAHEYSLVSTDMTYRMTGTVNAKGDLTILGETDSTTGRPPCIQPGVQTSGDVLGTLFVVSGDNAVAHFEGLYLLAASTNGTANGGGVAIELKGEGVDLNVFDCVFDGWQTFAIAYNGNWPNMYIHDNVFRNMVHPNQHYIGEVVRNAWPIQRS